MTNDGYWSMDNGLVLSRVLNLMTEETWGESYWKRFISAPANWQVELIAEPENDELSKAESDLIREQYEKFQKMFGHWGADDRWKLVDYTHHLPEWRNPHGSSLPVAYEEVLIKAEVPREKVDKIIQSMEEFVAFENIMGK